MPQFHDESSASTERIAQAVIDFVTAQGWEERQRVYKAKRSELLSQEADRILDSFLSERGRDENTVLTLRACKALLARYRRMKDKPALIEHLDAVEILAVIPEIMERFARVGSSAEFRELLQDFPEVMFLLEQERAASKGSDSHLSYEASALIREIISLRRPEEMPRKIELCRTALEMIDRGTDLESWAMIEIELANALSRNPSGNRADNIEEAIKHYKQALSVYKAETHAEEWITIMSNLGSAYNNRVYGQPGDNAEEARRYCEEALTVCNSDNYPGLWAMVQTTLGIAYMNRTQGKRADNIEKTIECTESALKTGIGQFNPYLAIISQINLAAAYRERIYGDPVENMERALESCMATLGMATRQRFPFEWGMIHYNLSLIYRNRLRGDKASNIEQAIEHCNLALEVFEREVFPFNWANTTNSLGNAYNIRIKGDYGENLQRAIDCFRSCLRIYTRERYPQQWALVESNIGNTYLYLELGARADNIDKAIEHSQNALKVYTPQNNPIDWARTQNILATAYARRISGEHAENVEFSIKHFELSLRIYTRDGFPFQWANAQNNLGNAYAERILGDVAENIEAAINYYGLALQVFTIDRFPENAANTLDNIGSAYLKRIRGNIADNVENAIEYHERSLAIYTYEAFPREWARVQNNLALSYRRRIKGEKADNIEQSISHQEESLKVFTSEGFPESWARAHNNLAAAYHERIYGDSSDNFESAIQHYKSALEVYKREAFPKQWAMVHSNLGNVYQDRLLGERAENLEQATGFYELSLEVYTRAAYPENWAHTSRNLANAYIRRARASSPIYIDKAISGYTDVLAVYTKESYPKEWADVQAGFASAYTFDHETGRADSVEKALAYVRNAMEVITLPAFPIDYQRLQEGAANLLFEEMNWDAAYEKYVEVIKAGELLLLEAYTEAGRLSEIAKVSRAYAHAAYCLVQKGLLDAAFVLFENGKTRLLSEALALSEDNLATISDAERQTIIEIRNSIRAIEAEMRLPPDTPARRGNAELGQLLKQARSKLKGVIANAESFQLDALLIRPQLQSILELVPQGGAMVALLVTSRGSVAFILQQEAKTITKDRVVELNEFGTSYLAELIFGSEGHPGWLLAYEIWKLNNSVEELNLHLKTLMQALWDRLMGPIHTRLKELGVGQGAELVLLPQGVLSLLPLHAALRIVEGCERFIIDTYAVSYIPSASALSVSSRRVKDRRSHKPSLFAVINPTKDLPYTSFEGEVLDELFAQADCLMLVEDQATKDRIIKGAEGRTYLHFACHGFYNWKDAMQSGLLLAQSDRFTLSKIISTLRLNAARLVVLSACETGIAEFQRSPDEYIGLPAGFLQAGSPAVVSTLWAVNDMSTMLLIERFYVNLFRGLCMAEALRDAQLWLRNVTAGELAGRFMEELRKPRAEGRIPYDRISAEWRRLSMMSASARPFSSPIFWAAFTITGT